MLVHLTVGINAIGGKVTETYYYEAASIKNLPFQNVKNSRQAENKNMDYKTNIIPIKYGYIRSEFEYSLRAEKTYTITESNPDLPLCLMFSST